MKITDLGSRNVLGMRVDATSYADATRRILGWARGGESRFVCVANVHMTMECFDDPDFQRVVNGADLVTPDGVPLVWALKALGIKEQTRVYGPDLTLHVCEGAARDGVPVAFYGGTEESLQELQQALRKRFPNLKIACAISPPFRPLEVIEDEKYTSALRASGARILFVGIGCPKQERWMAAHQHQISAVMLGVGAAFDFHTGRVKQAPQWIQRVGMEWLFRLLMEPRRLWKRYFKHNPRFVLFFILQLLGMRRFKED